SPTNSCDLGTVARTPGASTRCAAAWPPPTWSAGSGPSGRLSSGGRRWRRLGQIGPLDLPRLVHLEDVAFLHVVEAVEQDPALEALCNFADVVLEALELRDRRLVDDRAVADDANRCAAADVALRHLGAGLPAHPRRAAH